MTLIREPRVQRQLGDGPIGRDELAANEIEPALAHKFADRHTKAMTEYSREVHAALTAPMTLLSEDQTRNFLLRDRPSVVGAARESLWHASLR